jgi:hypothetical protein
VDEWRVDEWRAKEVEERSSLVSLACSLVVSSTAWLFVALCSPHDCHSSNCTTRSKYVSYNSPLNYCTTKKVHKSVAVAMNTSERGRVVILL